MLRSVLSAVALAGLLATTLPVSADPNAAKESDHSNAAETAPVQAAPAASSWQAPAAVPGTGGHENDIPVGTGWG